MHHKSRGIWREAWRRYREALVIPESTARRATRWIIWNGLGFAFLAAGFYAVEAHALPFWRAFAGAVAFGIAGLLLGSKISRWKMKRDVS